MNTKFKIITPVMFIVFGFCSCFTTIFITHSNDDLEKFTALYAEGIQAIASTVLEQTGLQYKKRIKSFLNYNNNQSRENMLKAFANQDREELLRLTTPYFELFQKEDPYFATLTWLFSDSSSFLHMHDTNKPSKNVSGVRPDIVSANKKQIQLAGFALSSAGMQYRIVNPVTYEGKHLGVLHFGMQVCEFIDAIQDKLGIPVGLVISREQYERIKQPLKPSIAGSSFAVLSSQIGLFEDDFGKIDWTLHKQQVVLHGKDYIIIKAISLDNYIQESQGHIFVALDISEQIAATRSDIIFILILSSVLLLLSFLILYFGYGSLAQKIVSLQIVEKVKNELEKKVTERTTALRLSENKFRSLVEDLNDWVWEVDENGVYTYASPTVVQILGFTPDEMLGKTPFDFMEPAEAKRVGDIFKQHIEKKSVLKSIININIHNDGQKVILETSGRAIIDESGTFKGYRGIDRDITQRQKVEDAIQKEKELLSVTLRSIGDAVITTDTEGKVIFLNKIAEELTGWTKKEAEGKLSTEVFSIINEKTGQKCVSPVQRVLELGRIIGLANHTALIAKDGTCRSIADSGAPIRDRESNIIGVVLVFRDVTHEKKTEEELLKIKKLESVGILAGGIAHDFNNILSAILGNLELVSHRIPKEDEEINSLLSDAKKATRRATKLTGQLLTFSKGGNPVKEEISLPKLISESADFVLHGSKVLCTYSFPEHLWMVDVDSGQIGQVIQNIIINAKQAMPEGGTVTIQCANVFDVATEELLSVDKGDYVRITIKDTGVGIPKTIIDKIFDPYFSTKQEGSGLGLAICHSIVNKHDGYLTVNSITEKGTTFTLYIPAIRSNGNSLTEDNNTAPPAKAARIIVMDDEEMLRNVARSMLKILGHRPILVANGAQAINKYQEMQDLGTPVDLVIMDLTIPGGMGGQETARKLLQIDPEAKLIVASGYSNDPVMSDYKEYGFCAAIAKPFDLKELSNTIASAM